MKKILLGLVCGVVVVTATAAPVKMTKSEMDRIVAGANPNIAPNGTNVNSNGASGAPGGSFGAPGQTTNPNPGK